MYSILQSQTVSDTEHKGLPKVIAITGAKRCGKDTLANYIASKYGYENIKLAQPLKQIVKILFDFTDEQLESDIKEVVDVNWQITPRKALQFFGTEICQYKIQELLPVDRKFLVKSMINKMNPNKCYVISDMRFYHEYEEIAKLNPLIIKITRPQLAATDSHPSETEYRSIPNHINLVNDKETNDLIQQFENSIHQQ